MSENSIYEFSKCWNPHRLKRLFEGMIIVGATGTGVGIAFHNRRVVDAGVASTIAGITGRVVLALLGY